MISRVLLSKAVRVMRRKLSAFAGRLYPLQDTLEAMTLRPYELHLELTNICNANCVFCPYQFQVRPFQVMPDSVFYKAVDDFVKCGGGGVGLTPIVGDALIDPQFISRVRYLRSLPGIDRIWVITNGILLDKRGIDNVLDCGLTSITISTSGFHEPSYTRIYRSKWYKRVHQNVLNLLERNATCANPVPITIALRSDRPLEEVVNDSDFRPILAYRPQIDFTWSFTSANGRITRDVLPEGMRLREIRSRHEACVQLYNGPIVLPDGTVMACSCVAAMDAMSDLGIGNVETANLVDMWKGEPIKALRAGFAAQRLNKTCAGCDMYRDLELYRTSEGRHRARLNRARYEGHLVKRSDRPSDPFAGG